LSNNKITLSFTIDIKDLTDALDYLGNSRKTEVAKLVYAIKKQLYKSVSKTKTKKNSKKTNPYFIDDRGIYKQLRTSKHIVDYYNTVVNNKVYEVAQAFRAELVANATMSEKIFKAILKSLKIKYEFQHVVFVDTDGKFFIVDFYLPDYNVGIEIDGGYHADHEQMLKDSQRTKTILKKVKMRDIIRFKNDEVGPTDYFRNRLQGILDASGLAKVPITKLIDK
jgi:very-short-patch-repair endonuclease